MKGIANTLACGALAVALGLAGCGAASSDGTGTAAPEDSPAVETTDDTTLEESSDVEAPTDTSALDAVFEEYARQLESTRDDYINALSDYETWPAEFAEALSVNLDEDQERMTTNLNETYEFGVQRLKEMGAPEEETQAYIDRLGALRDECVDAVLQTIDELRP